MVDKMAKSEGVTERGVIITAINGLRNKRIEEGKSIEFVNDVFIKSVGK